MPPRRRGTGIDVDIEVRAQDLIRAFKKLEDNGERYLDDALRSMANDSARRSRARAPGWIRNVIRVHKIHNPGFQRAKGYLVGADQRFEGDRIPNLLNYGTLKRRLKSKTKEPGRYYPGKQKRAAPGSAGGRWAPWDYPGKRTGRRHANEGQGGIKAQKFIWKVPRAKQIAELVDALERAARRSGFQVKKGR